MLMYVQLSVQQQVTSLYNITLQQSDIQIHLLIVTTTWLELTTRFFLYNSLTVLARRKVIIRHVVHDLRC